MHLIHVGSRGEQVRSVQQTLREFGSLNKVDGIFGPRTERAVRAAQRRFGVFPADGVVGPVTRRAFSEQQAGSATPKPAAPRVAQRSQPAPPSQPAAPPKPAAPPVRSPTRMSPQLAQAAEGARARAQTMPAPQGGSIPITTLRPSAALRRFIYNHEAQRNVSNRLHWPGGASGVTLGPGYDMKERSAAAIAADLQRIGVPEAAAVAVSRAAGLRTGAARDFARNNKALVDLTRVQEEALLIRILPQYQAKVARAVRVDLQQHEYDAMISYAYNPGGGWRRVTQHVNARQHSDAMEELSRHVTSGGEVVRSLVRRRRAEARMFLYGEYQ